jgi:hypothetical protein
MEQPSDAPLQLGMGSPWRPTLKVAGEQMLT